MANRTLALVRKPSLRLIKSIERRIYFVRRQKVLLDFDLAALYHVSTKAFNQAVRRNLARFPADFMFQLTPDEAEILRSQFVTSSWGGRRYLPYAFTEQGVAMLSSVLKTGPAIQVNIAIMRTFVKLREILATHKELAQKIHELEKKFQRHDSDIHAVFEAIRSLLAQREDQPARHRIGFPNETA